MVVDVSKPLCRGRKIYWDKDEGWAAFMYERLSKICYWCGSVSHDDKDCSLWLRSKGTLTVAEQQFGLWIRAPLYNPAKKSFVEVKGYEHVNSGATDGFASVMNASDAGVSGLNEGFENTITSFVSRAINENSLVHRCVEGFMDDDEHVSSSLKLSRSLQMEEDDARAVPDFEGQLQLLDCEIDSSPNLSKLKPCNSDAVSVDVPIFSHAESRITVSTENQELKKVDARYNVEAAPIFSHAKPCINVPTTGQGLNNEVIGYDGDSLEAIRKEEFNVGQTSTLTEKRTETPKEKKDLMWKT